jgi:hypothetical protein
MKFSLHITPSLAAALVPVQREYIAAYYKVTSELFSFQFSGFSDHAICTGPLPRFFFALLCGFTIPRMPVKSAGLYPDLVSMMHNFYQPALISIINNILLH